MPGPLKRHKALVNLSRDHYHGLLLALVLRKDTPVNRKLPSTLAEKVSYAKAKYREDLLEHFRIEEEVLFPFVKGRSPEADSLIEELTGEHRKLETLIGSFDDPSDLESRLDQAGHLLEKHIRKEERSLFRLIQENFSEMELNDLQVRMDGGKKER